MPDEVVLYILNDHIIKVNGLKDGATDTPINDATITATIVNHEGVPIGGVTWPITLSYVEDSAGNYLGLLEEDAEIALGGYYSLVVNAEAYPDVKGHWRKQIRVKERE